jgi:hypothetical protein
MVAAFKERAEWREENRDEIQQKVRRAVDET